MSEAGRPAAGQQQQAAATQQGGINRRGFGLREQILGDLDKDYHSQIVETIRAHDSRWTAGRLHIRIAKAFGFCYGVDKAIALAYETRKQFPDRRIFLTNEIIHNPRVNARMKDMGIRILDGTRPGGAQVDEIEPRDVVILPAFGAHTELLERLKALGAVLVDTTCGSVVHVWKRVERYAHEGFTAIIHGKWRHEETVATCSQVTARGGHYLVVRDRPEARHVCAFIAGRPFEDTPVPELDWLRERFEPACSPGFDFGRDLARVGCANQTTMLSSESLEIADMFRRAIALRDGDEQVQARFRSFDTICNATQERQDAVLEMMREPPDLMLVVGGFNSSNTGHLCEIASEYCTAYHVDDVGCLISPAELRHLPPGSAQPAVARDWLPARRPLEIGLTAGASTPNRVIGEVIERLIEWEEARGEGG